MAWTTFPILPNKGGILPPHRKTTIHGRVCQTAHAEGFDTLRQANAE